MKQFNLEEYLKNPTRKIVTRDGRNVRILCTDREGSIYPIIALIKDDKIESEILVTYTKDGIPAEYNEAYYTLFFMPEKKEGWVNIYKVGNDMYKGSYIWSTEEDAKKEGNKWDDYVTTTKIEWEE